MSWRSTHTCTFLRLLCPLRNTESAGEPFNSAIYKQSLKKVGHFLKNALLWQCFPSLSF